MIRLLRYALSLVGFLAGLAVLGGIVAVGLVLAGSSELKACQRADGTEVPISHDPATAGQFQVKLVTLLATLASGEPASTSFTNDEVSARATAYVRERGASVDNITVCLEPGYTLVSATALDILGRDLSFRFEGEIDLSGEHPRIRVDAMKAGKLPLPGPAREIIENRFNDLLEDLVLDHRFDVEFVYEAVNVEAQPGR